MLSERDHKILCAIETDLARESPRLARLLRAPCRSQRWQRRGYDALLVCAVATTLLCLVVASGGLLAAACLSAAVAVLVGLVRHARFPYRFRCLQRSESPRLRPDHGAAKE